MKKVVLIGVLSFFGIMFAFPTFAQSENEVSELTMFGWFRSDTEQVSVYCDAKQENLIYVVPQAMFVLNNPDDCSVSIVTDGVKVQKETWTLFSEERWVFDVPLRVYCDKERHNLVYSYGEGVSIFVIHDPEKCK